MLSYADAVARAGSDHACSRAAGSPDVVVKVVKGNCLAAALLAGAETAADLTAGLLSTTEVHVGLGLSGLFADDC